MLLVTATLPLYGWTLWADYRERVTIALKFLPHLGAAARSAYEQMFAQQISPHTRIDIRQWYEAG